MRERLLSLAAVSVFLFLMLSAVSPVAVASPDNQKQIRVVVRSSSDRSWQIVSSGAFGSPRVSCKRGENLIILAANPETGKAIPKGEGTIEGHIISGSKAGSALLKQRFEVPAWARIAGGSKGQKAKSWSSRTLSIITNLNRGTKFARNGGVMLPITEDFPKAMAVTVDAPDFKPLTFKLTVGGGRAGGGKGFEVGFNDHLFQANQSNVVTITRKKSGNPVKLDSISVSGPKVVSSNPLPSQGKIQFTPGSRGWYTIRWTVNGRTRSKTFATQGYRRGGGGGGGSIPWLYIGIIIIVIAALLTFKYKDRLPWSRRAEVPGH